MKLAALAILGLATITACEQRRGEESGRAVDAADTIVTSEQDVDTAIVTQDTAVEVDTVKQDDDEPARSDTLKQTTPTTPADTGVDTLQR
jgi:hypothetical protein